MLVKAAYWVWCGENHFGGLLMLTEAACQVYLGGSCCGGLSAGAGKLGRVGPQRNSRARQWC